MLHFKKRLTPSVSVENPRVQQGTSSSSVRTPYYPSAVQLIMRCDTPGSSKYPAIITLSTSALPEDTSPGATSSSHRLEPLNLDNDNADNARQAPPFAQAPLRVEIFYSRSANLYKWILFVIVAGSSGGVALGLIDLILKVNSSPRILGLVLLAVWFGVAYRHFVPVWALFYYWPILTRWVYVLYIIIIAVLRGIYFY